MAYCSNCGKSVSNDALFCQHCETRRSSPTPSAPPLPVEPVIVQVPDEPVIALETKASVAEMAALISTAKNVIPDHLEKEWAKLLKAGDEVMMYEFVQQKIVPLLVEHDRQVDNTKFNPGEEAQWVHEIRKGFFKSYPVEKWIITNQRAIVYRPKTEDQPESQKALGLALCDVLIMNQFRKSNSNHVGCFVGRKGVGVGVGNSRSTSISYGDLVFMFNGKEEFRFSGISDPAGVKRMVETMKKQIRV